MHFVSLVRRVCSAWHRHLSIGVVFTLCEEQNHASITINFFNREIVLALIWNPK